MRVLIVEDDFVCRQVLAKCMAEYGEVDTADDGAQAVQIIARALADHSHYHLITLDLMMPNMGGQETLKEIRALETASAIQPGDGAKIIMTTALSDSRNIMQAFRHQCEAYLIKPIRKQKLDEELKKLGLIEANAA